MMPKPSDSKFQKHSLKGISAKRPFFDVNRKKLKCFLKTRDQLSVSPHCKFIELLKDSQLLREPQHKLKNYNQNRIQDSPDLAKKAMDTVIKRILKHGMGQDWSQSAESSARSLSPLENSFSNNNIWKSDWASQSMSHSYSESGYTPFSQSSDQKITPRQYNLSTLPSSLNVSFEAYNQTHFPSQPQQEIHVWSKFQIEYQQILIDGRTTVMIKNIPNKYGLTALEQQINISHAATYDFLYIPFDYQSSCNMGYAFINFLNPEHLKSFFAVFNLRKWLKYKSQKICVLRYARLQGRSNLIEHFQKSKVLQKGKSFRPIIKDFTEIKEIIAKQKRTSGIENNN